MTTFIHDVLKDLQNKNQNLSDLTFVLPSKRAGLFLKNELTKVINQTVFAPQILSIEEFVEELSQLKSISNTELLFEFYSIYKKHTKKEQTDAFESFSKWAQILLQDFNEIDRYLIPQEKIFNYLSAIQDLNHWSLQENKTDFVKNYLSFWNKLYNYYTHFTDYLLNKKVGYQGLVYREAVENLEAYIQNNLEKTHIFVGFNALNTSEETIIQELLQNNLAKIYWDIDKVFMNNQKHDAALFTRQHLSNWKYFKNNTFNWITENYSRDKNISAIGIPKNIGQAKYIGSLLSDLQKNNDSLNNTAVVLGDENLLIPVLNSLPSSIKALNVTMGFPLKSIPLASLFDALFKLHKINSNSFYYKDVINIISHQFIKPLLYIKGIDYSSKIVETIDNNNLVYLNKDRLSKITKQNSVIDLLFSNWQNSIPLALESCSKLILEVKYALDKNKSSNLLSLEYVFRFNELFNELTRLNNEHEHIKDISSLYSIYKELLSSETLDFQGEPLQGLQLMGMLESRVLDFETVIISSVNEGILPAGKSNNSFIPFDVKLENNLPTYKEKDAVYTYHFYKLLQRAKNVYIVYNTEADVLTGGEKSRFITQLELEDIHTINHQIIAPEVPTIERHLNVVKKTEALQKQIIETANQGFSPSSLTNYMRNPIDFYYQKILKIKDHDDVEETVAANTLGTVVHNTLEDFYEPFIGHFLTVEGIENLKPKIEQTVSYHFKKEYKEGDITKGKNLIVFEVAKRYVSNFLDLEIKALKAGDKIKIIAIEANNNITINISELDFPIRIKGKVDRVDACNGTTRIIDYKTGSVQQNQVEVVNWEDITTDYKKYSKSFQILTYAYMMHTSKEIQLPIEAGIISFKKLNDGFLKFAKKESAFSRSKNTLITDDTLIAFENELKKLIIEICNPKIDFTEKEV
ncbi:MAG: PD-(D/E)XK nuclease family protein [Algibacter sp.]|uniref:PD-(D/E)XK nuclease family protein n=1 Tax=Algibacter sp. TaxID=1872428 RepID=UPI0026283914|nr:PD-(D/E)XK nuclease family protein [Algibacter sp.]MDG1728575.1 PD-(D/E)XK nuclease family protein [Algibacter sp.]MDG2179234.1 PD-(D/E)XK nuclease family protein [Algibacter sp.]